MCSAEPRSVKHRSLKTIVIIIITITTILVACTLLAVNQPSLVKQAHRTVFFGAHLSKESMCTLEHCQKDCNSKHDGKQYSMARDLCITP